VSNTVIKSENFIKVGIKLTPSLSLPLYGSMSVRPSKIVVYISNDDNPKKMIKRLSYYYGNITMI